MMSYSTIPIPTATANREPKTLKRLESISTSEATRLTRLQCASIVVVLLSIICRSFLPENLTLGAVVCLFTTVVTSLRSVSNAKAVTVVIRRPFVEQGDVWEEPLSSQQVFGGSTKIMWGYWNSYPEEFPYLCEKALESWRLRNPGWAIVMLHDNNFKEYVSVSDLPSTFYSLKVQHRSDIIRLAVLIRYGGVYLDASTLVYKGFDGIWDNDTDDSDNKVLITSLNQLPDAQVDMYNNGLLMTKGLQNPFLVEWRRRILDYSEAPALTQADMKSHPAFARVHQHWDDPTLGVLGGMVPYHSNLWILNDMIWHDVKGLSKHIVHLPKIRWGFYYHSLPHFFDKLKVMTSSQAQDNRHNPAFVEWSALSMLYSVAKHMRHGFFDSTEMAQGVIDNVHILKFTSHDMPLVDIGINKVGLNNTVGRIIRAAYDLEEYPIRQATLEGALPPALLVQQQQQQ